MPKNTGKHKANRFNIPKPLNPPKTPERLPFDEKVLNQSITFSFALFDRKNKLFNLGGTDDDGTVGGKWFIGLLDCLKKVSGKTIQELKLPPFRLHPVNWKNANLQCPFSPDEDWWQFRLNKSGGRVIGLLIDKVFYVVWLDPHHNLTDSEGYGGKKNFRQPLSEYEENST